MVFTSPAYIPSRSFGISGGAWGQSFSSLRRWKVCHAHSKTSFSSQSKSPPSGGFRGLTWKVCHALDRNLKKYKRGRHLEWHPRYIKNTLLRHSRGFRGPFFLPIGGFRGPFPLQGALAGLSPKIFNFMYLFAWHCNYYYFCSAHYYKMKFSYE